MSNTYKIVAGVVVVAIASLVWFMTRSTDQYSELTTLVDGDMAIDMGTDDCLKMILTQTNLNIIIDGKELSKDLLFNNLKAKINFD